MQNINAGGTSSSTSKPNGLEGLAKMFTQNSGILKTVAKLSLILAAITIMVKLITKITDRIIDSSPILQTMLKLLQTSITFILRPIGDFIGFFLRPFLIFFLRNVALPMYQLLGPIARSLGAFFGGNLLSNLTLNYDPELDPLFGPNGIFKDIGATFAKWRTQLGSIKFPTFDNVLTAFNAFTRKLVNFTVVILEKIRPFLPSMENIWKLIGIFSEKLKSIVEKLKPIAIEALRGLGKIFTIIPSLIGPIIEKIVSIITGILDFVLDIINPLKEVLKSVFSTITDLFNSIRAFFDSISDIIKSIFPNFGNNSNSGSTTSSVTTTNQFFADAQQFGQGVLDQIFDAGNQVVKDINNAISGRPS